MGWSRMVEKITTDADPAVAPGVEAAGLAFVSETYTWGGLFEAAPTQLNGTLGDDVIHGSGAAEVLRGFDGDDALYGYDGNDDLYGNAGANLLVGGDGLDEYFVESLADDIVELAEDGDYDRVIASVTGYRLPDNVENLRIEDYLPGFDHYTQMSFGYGNSEGNTLMGNNYANCLEGEGGDDILLGEAGDDTLLGGDGADQLDGSVGNDTLYGGEGADDLDGYTGDDVLEGGGSNDVIEGWIGNDVLKGGLGSDMLYGGYGDDILDGGGWTDTLDGGAGSDTVLYTDNVVSVRIDLVAGLAAFPTETWASETLISIENARTGSGDDILIGNSADNRFEGGAGDDTYYINSLTDEVIENADEGTDRIYVSVGRFALGSAHVEELVLQGNVFDGYGNGLDNVLTGNAADNLLDGKSGDDTLHGHAGSDSLIGRAGVDTLYGGAGDDTLDGEAMYGGTGDDMYRIRSAGDLVVEDMGEGIDIVTSSANIMALAANVENLTLINTAYFGVGNRLGNVVLGTDGGNRLEGLDGDDFVYGNGGKDYVFGGAGDDFLDGGSGSDGVFAGEGADTVYGGDGNDRVGGGAQNDAVYGGNGDDVVTGDNGSDVLWGGRGDDVLDGGSVRDTMYGGEGNDRIYGGVGVDVLDGGAGNDVFVFNDISWSGKGRADVVQGSDVAAFETPGDGLGDLFVLTGIDADTTVAGHQALAWGGAQGDGWVNYGTGYFWFWNVGEDTHLRANTDADTAYEFDVIIRDGSVMASAYSSLDVII